MPHNESRYQSASWRWHQPIPGVPDIAGGITSLFKAQGSDPPAALRPLFPDQGERMTRASMFAREAVANSWDAYWISGYEHQDFELIFRFRTLGMSEGYGFRKAANLDALTAHIGSRGGNPTRRDLGLSEKDCFGERGDIRVLEVVERWGGGMSGSWKSGDSALERALIKVGWAQDASGAGGSFGYGKAAVAQGSRINSVIAYTCFPENEDDPGVTRRLLGATYWRPHTLAGEKFNGFAVFGEHEGGLTRPLENDVADAVAGALGLSVRDPAVEADWGTTLLIIDPSFEKDDLVAALLCNWWPALLRLDERRMHLFVTEDDDEPVEVDVDGENPILGPFVRTYRAAFDVLDGGEPNFDEDSETEIGSIATLTIESEDGEVLGCAALVETAATEHDKKSLVALMRSHRMVVRYLESATVEPVVRGTFIAHDGANEALRQTEPPEHDNWLRRRTGDHRGDPADYRRAAIILDQINHFVGKFRRLRTPPPPEKRGWTPAFSNFFAIPGAAASRTPTKRKRTERPATRRRPIHINLVHPERHTEVERPTRMLGSKPGSLKATAIVRFSLMDWVTDDELPVEFELGSRIEEEGGRSEALALTVTPPRGVTCITDGRRGRATYRGTLKKGNDLFFMVETDDYFDEWTVAVYFDAHVLAGVDGGSGHAS